MDNKLYSISLWIISWKLPVKKYKKIKLNIIRGGTLKGDLSCKNDFYGPLCQSCPKLTVKNMFYSICDNCPNNSTNIGITILYLTLFFGFYFIIIK